MKYVPQQSGHNWIIPGADLPPLADFAHATILADALNAAYTAGRTEEFAEHLNARDEQGERF